AGVAPWRTRRHQYRHRYFRRRPAAGAARLCATRRTGSGLHLDPGLLGMGSVVQRLLLGTGYLGDAARNRPVVDARLVGLVRRILSLACRLLEPARRLL